MMRKSRRVHSACISAGQLEGENGREVHG